MRTGRRWGGYSAIESRWLIVVAVGGAVVLLGLWAVVRVRPNLGIDREGFRLLALHRGRLSALRTHELEVGGVYAVALAALAASTCLAWKRRWTDVAAIVLGSLAVGLAADAAKSIAQRPRPAHPLILASGYSFPSSDSAISVTLLAVAFGVARLSSRPQRRLEIVMGATMVVVICDLGFVALRVHFLTDVVAGWGLGVMVFAVCALFVDRLVARHQRRVAGRVP